MPRALRLHSFTGIDGIRIDDVPLPQPKGREVRIKVEAFALNFGDLELFENAYVFGLELPSSFGDEAAGIVDAVGPDVTRFKVGDRVSTVTFLNEGYPVDAEYCLFPEDYVAPVPAHMNALEGASIWVQYLCSYFAFHDVAQIKEAEWVLVTAASSSAGIAATQLAKQAGARVIGTSRSFANRDFILETGADAVIATEEEDISQRINDITNGAGTRIVYDAICGSLVSRYAGGFARDAIVFLYGDISGEDTVLPTLEGIQKNAVFRPHSVYNFIGDSAKRERAIAFITQALERGEIAPRIDRTFEFEDYRDAFAYQVKATGRRGKIIVRVRDSADIKTSELKEIRR